MSAALAASSAKNDLVDSVQTKDNLVNFASQIDLFSVFESPSDYFERGNPNYSSYRIFGMKIFD